MNSSWIAPTLLNPLLALHVGFATIGLMGGFLAMTFRKGSGLHGAAGAVFFVSMLVASVTGATIAIAFRPNSGNTMVSALTLYLVATGWVAARRRAGRPGPFDFSALLLVIVVGVAGTIWGVQALHSGSGSKDGYPYVFYFAFSAITLLFAVSDVRMIARGGVSGKSRIARHLLRMSMTMLLAILSSEGRVSPPWLRRSPLVHVPAVLVVGMMAYWLIRVSVGKRVPAGGVRASVIPPKVASTR